MGLTTIYKSGNSDQDLYLRPLVYDPIHRKWGQKDSYYLFNNSCKKIGSGSMGTVYLCQEYKDSKDLVAVKIVKEQFCMNQKIRQRAHLEASMSFAHPNLIEMLGYCEYNPDSGPLLILSRYFHGKTINDYILNKGIASSNDIDTHCKIIIQALAGLEYIHSFKITHRDIKPSNIMVNEQGQVKLMDLGIARVHGGNEFSTIGFVGTPEYAAPEQIRGEDNIGAYTDIYSMGITFYELLAGYNPFKDDSELTTMNNQLNKKLPGSYQIPRNLMKVIRKATEKKPSDRFQTAEEFRLAIENYLQGDGILKRIKKWLYT